MTNFVKIQGYSNLVKDKQNGGVVNIDKQAYKNHLLARNVAKKNFVEKEQIREDVDSMKTEINSIKQDLGDIKIMLQTLLSKGQ